MDPRVVTLPPMHSFEIGAASIPGLAFGRGQADREGQGLRFKQESASQRGPSSVPKAKASRPHGYHAGFPVEVTTERGRTKERRAACRPLIPFVYPEFTEEWAPSRPLS